MGVLVTVTCGGLVLVGVSVGTRDGEVDVFVTVSRGDGRVGVFVTVTCGKLVLICVLVGTGNDETGVFVGSLSMGYGLCEAA